MRKSATACCASSESESSWAGVIVRGAPVTSELSSNRVSAAASGTISGASSATM